MSSRLLVVWQVRVVLVASGSVCWSTLTGLCSNTSTWKDTESAEVTLHGGSEATRLRTNRLLKDLRARLRIVPRKLNPRAQTTISYCDTTYQRDRTRIFTSCRGLPDTHVPGLRSPKSVGMHISPSQCKLEPWVWACLSPSATENLG